MLALATLPSLRKSYASLLFSLLGSSIAIESLTMSVNDCADIFDLPPTARWYHRHGRHLRKEKATRQQYLSP